MLAPDETTYVHADLECDGTYYRLKCPCGSYMEPMWGERLDQDWLKRDYMWHMCEEDGTHITEPIVCSPAFRSAFTKTF